MNDDLVGDIVGDLAEYDLLIEEQDHPLFAGSVEDYLPEQGDDSSAHGESAEKEYDLLIEEQDHPLFAGSVEDYLPEQGDDSSAHGESAVITQQDFFEKEYDLLIEEQDHPLFAGSAEENLPKEREDSSAHDESAAATQQGGFFNFLKSLFSSNHAEDANLYADSMETSAASTQQQAAGNTALIMGAFIKDSKRKIEGHARDLFGLSAKTTDDTQQTHDVFIPEDELVFVGATAHGSHNVNVAEHARTGEKYVAKDCSQHEAQKEFIAANFLHEVSSHNPECKLMENKDHTVSVLSSKHTNTVDAEEFVQNGGIPKLTTQRVEGLADTLVANAVLGETSDTKLANMLVTTTSNGLIVKPIDHERAVVPNPRFNDWGVSSYPTTPKELAGLIYDGKERSDENRSGLAGTPLGKEFVQEAEKLITPKDIQTAYRKIASADIGPVMKKCHSAAKHSTLFSGKNSCEEFGVMLKEIQRNAANTADQLEQQVSRSNTRP